MFDWIDMDVINMIVKITLIKNHVRPITALPDWCFTLNLMRLVSGSTRSYVFDVFPGEETFDFLPPHRIISVIFRQFPNSVNMVREQAHGYCLKKVAWIGHHARRSAGNHGIVGLKTGAFDN